MSSITTGTGAGLMNFVDYAADAGLIGHGAHKQYRAAVRRVLSTLDDPAGVDVKEMDVQDVLHRWLQDHADGLREVTIQTYQSRFQQAVDMYVAWLDNEDAPAQGARRRGVTRSLKSEPDMHWPAVGLDVVDVRKGAEHLERLVTHAFPLRPDLIIHMTLPTRLTRHDADRVATFVRSLAFGDSPPKQAGTGTSEGGA